MSRKINTRTRYKIIGSDYSAQEPRLTAFVSQDQTMIDAYMKGQDLYAVIAQSAFDNNYEDNLEFYPEFTELNEGDKIAVAGSGKEMTVSTNGTNFIEVPWCYLLPTLHGDVAANKLTTADIIISDIGNLKISSISDIYLKDNIKHIKICFQE